jgi:ubiquinone/menaquinone biosynthesis C-methylase UbiE
MSSSDDEKRDFDKEAQNWDKGLRIKMATDVANAIRREANLAKDMDVLDFGCGTGLLTLQLQPLVRSVTGVDLSAGMLEMLDAKLKDLGITNVKTRRVDLDGGDALEGSFDLVVSSMTLHHIKEPKALVDMLFRVTAPSGCICLADLDLDDGEFHRDNHGVFHFGFDREFLGGVFEGAGYTDVRAVDAAEVVRPDSRGQMRAFGIFLMTGRKP